MSENSIDEGPTIEIDDLGLKKQKSRDDSCIIKSPTSAQNGLSVPIKTTDSQKSSQMSVDFSIDEWDKNGNGDMFDDFDINEDILADIGNFTNLSSINKSVKQLLAADPTNKKVIE